MIRKLDIKTSSRTELLDITRRVRDTVQAWDADSGVCYVYVPHTTAAVTINESADPDVPRDLVDGLARLAPPDAGYRHTEGNSDAHIKSSLLGNSVTVFIENGDLVLGTWQGIFFGEFDGPRNRKVYIKVVGD